MKKTILFLSAALVFLPLIASAAIPNWGPLITCSGNPGGTLLPDGKTKLPQCKSLCDALATLKNVIEFGMTLALSVIAPLIFVWGGAKVLVSGANPALRSEGMKTIRGVIIAVVLVVTSFTIVNTFLTLLNLKQGQGFIQGFTEPIQCEVTPKP